MTMLFKHFQLMPLQLGTNKYKVITQFAYCPSAQVFRPIATALSLFTMENGPVLLKNGLIQHESTKVIILLF